MSECVVRMDIPESCAKCLAWSICPVLDEYMSAECYEWSFEDVLNMTDDEGFTKPEDCPIICSLPEGHGRLVDMMDIDSMMENASSTSDESGLYSLIYRDDLGFDRLPTIVPADASDAVVPTDTPTDTPTVPAERSET